MAEPIFGALFDKDGTLFDFSATWNAWAEATLMSLADGDFRRAVELGELISFDMEAGEFDASSEVIAGTSDTIARLLQPGLPGRSVKDIEDEVNERAAKAPQAEVVPLGPFIRELRALNLKIGVATNDSEMPARAHLASVGHEHSFDFIAGYDSGFGGKPAPGMCLGFAEAMGFSAKNVVMVGDSTHDLLAGRAAGMRTVAVLTGMATEEELASYANIVLPDIGHLPDWIRTQNLVSN